MQVFVVWDLDSCPFPDSFSSKPAAFASILRRHFRELPDYTKANVKILVSDTSRPGRVNPILAALQSLPEYEIVSDVSGKRHRVEENLKKRINVVLDSMECRKVGGVVVFITGNDDYIAEFERAREVSGAAILIHSESDEATSIVDIADTFDYCRYFPYSPRISWETFIERVSGLPSKSVERYEETLTDGDVQPVALQRTEPEGSFLLPMESTEKGKLAKSVHFESPSNLESKSSELEAAAQIRMVSFSERPQTKSSSNPTPGRSFESATSRSTESLPSRSHSDSQSATSHALGGALNPHESSFGSASFRSSLARPSESIQLRSYESAAARVPRSASSQFETAPLRSENISFRSSGHQSAVDVNAITDSIATLVSGFVSFQPSLSHPHEYVVDFHDERAASWFQKLTSEPGKFAGYTLVTISKQGTSLVCEAKFESSPPQQSQSRGAFHSSIEEAHVQQALSAIKGIGSIRAVNDRFEIVFLNQGGYTFFLRQHNTLNGHFGPYLFGNCEADSSNLRVLVAVSISSRKVVNPHPTELEGKAAAAASAVLGFEGAFQLLGDSCVLWFRNPSAVSYFGKISRSGAVKNVTFEDLKVDGLAVLCKVGILAQPAPARKSLLWMKVEEAVGWIKGLKSVQEDVDGSFSITFLSQREAILCCQFLSNSDPKAQKQLIDLTMTNLKRDANVVIAKFSINQAPDKIQSPEKLQAPSRVGSAAQLQSFGVPEKKMPISEWVAPEVVIQLQEFQEAVRAMVGEGTRLSIHEVDVESFEVEFKSTRSPIELLRKFEANRGLMSATVAVGRVRRQSDYLLSIDVLRPFLLQQVMRRPPSIKSPPPGASLIGCCCAGNVLVNIFSLNAGSHATERDVRELLENTIGVELGILEPNNNGRVSITFKNALGPKNLKHALFYGGGCIGDIAFADCVWGDNQVSCRPIRVTLTRRPWDGLA